MIKSNRYSLSRPLFSFAMGRITLGLSLQLLTACTPKTETETFSTIAEPKAAALAGKFYSLDNPYNTLELTADGKYTLTEGTHQVNGTWLVDGQQFILIGPSGKQAAGRVTGGRIVDPEGGQWVRY